MKKIITILCTCFILISCDDMLETTPEVSVNINNYWQDEQEVESFANSMHILFRSSFSNIPWVFGETRAQSTDAMSNWLWKYIYTNELDYGYLSFPWSSYYKVIASANTILDNYHRAEMSKERNDYYVGMSRFIRAYTYFFIVRVWGEAPLVTSSTDVSVKGKATIAEIRDFLLEDAEAAAELLPEYSTLTWADGSSVDTKQMPSKGAAYALLAHAYAWFGAMDNNDEMLQKSVDAASMVINDSEYSLASSIADVCEEVMLGNSSEGILEIEGRANTDDQLTSYAFLATLSTGYPIIPKKDIGDIDNWDMYNTILAESAKALFDDVNDERRSEYFYELDAMSELDESGGRAYLQKWRHVVVATDGTGDFETFEDNVILFRLADIILLRAEMNNRLGNTSAAIEDLNTIRNRAKASVYNATEGDLKLVILKERYRELYLENHRFFDLVRNDELRNMVESFKDVTDQDIEDGALYWPVQSSAFLQNSLMRQNIYWKQRGV